MSPLLVLLVLSCTGAAPHDSAGPSPVDGGGADGGAPDGGGAGDGGGQGDDTGGTPDCATLTWREDASVHLDTQAAVDPFCSQWNAVRGDLIVDVGGEVDPITQLDGLKCLCEVGGGLTITGNAAKAPPGAPPPPHVTGDIELSVLERVGGDLVITWHPALSYVESMRGLREIGGDLVLAGNPELQVASFYGLERVGGRVRVLDMDKQLILRLPQARTLGSLELGSPGDAATLYFLVEVKLDLLEEIEGDLVLHGPRNLALLSAPLLARVGGTLWLDGSCITDPALPALAGVGSLLLDGNCGLLDLDGLAGLRRITGQDAAGTSLRLAANEHLDAEELSAFVGQLESLGTGTAETANAGACADVMGAYGAGYCD